MDSENYIQCDDEEQSQSQSVKSTSPRLITVIDIC